jgi:hypothetical protein
MTHRLELSLFKGRSKEEQTFWCVYISCSSTDLSVEPSPITQTNLVSDTILERFLNCTSAIYFMKDFAQLRKLMQLK